MSVLYKRSLAQDGLVHMVYVGDNGFFVPVGPMQGRLAVNVRTACGSALFDFKSFIKYTIETTERPATCLACLAKED